MIDKIRTHWLFWVILMLAILVRVIGLDQNPPALYWEEIAIGYDAYSVALTGADHHDHPWPILAFESFGDWKPSLYFYAVLPFTLIFGPSVWSVRLPSVLAGLAIVIGCYFLIKKIFSSRRLGYWAMFLTAISPWAIQFSRGGWEVNLATALILWGVILVLESYDHLKIKNKKITVNWFLLGAIICLLLSLYAYHATRVIAPLLGLFLFITYLIIFFKKNKTFSISNKIKHLAPTLLMAVILVIVAALPFWQAWQSGQLQTRFTQTSVFSDPQPVLNSNQCRQDHQSSGLSRLYCHRYLFYGAQIAQNFFEHFRPDFLFTTGDPQLRHNYGGIGLFYPTDFLFLVLGIIFLIKNKKLPAWQKWFFLFWLVIGIFPAAISFPTPHALRILPTLPVWIILLISGLDGTFNIFQKKAKLTQIAIIAIYLVQFSLATVNYWLHYPVTASQDWQSGYAQMYQQLADYSATQPATPVYVTRHQGRPAMAYWFYQRVSPALVQAQASTALLDQGEFLTFTNAAGTNFYFLDTLAHLPLSTNVIVAARPDEFEQFQLRLNSNQQLQLIDQITDQQGIIIWQIQQLVTSQEANV